jgi:anti-sigma regulatory factor (Ser/Thr protein kinase)
MNRPLNTSVSIAVDDSSQTGEVRRAAQRLADRLGWNDTDRGRLGIIANELANNLWKHAGHGNVLIRPLTTEDVSGLEIMTVDRGPGMDVARSLRDGHSTGGTPGNGLGAVQRLSTVFDAYSVPGKATVVLAQVTPAAVERRPPLARLEIGAVSLPMPGEIECGDAWTVDSRGAGKSRVLVVDGLGHGPDAAAAAQTAVQLFDQLEAATPERTIDQLHQALRPTRGAAGLVLELDLVGGRIVCAGVGNIAACLTSPLGTRSFVSHNGTLGHQSRRAQEFTYPWQQEIMVAASDGLMTRWKLDDYPGIHARHPSIIAALLHLDFKRGRDDVTVLVIKKAKGSMS